jgi:hypothetical protein
MQRLAAEVGEYLPGRRALVNLGVHFVFELAAQEPAVFIGEFHGLVEHAGAFFRGRRQDHLRAEESQQLTALEAEALGHDDHKRIAFLRADHCEADAGIAARRLDDRLPRPQFAALLRALDDGACHAVLDRSQRVERLDLGVDVNSGRRQPVQPDQWCVANRLQNILVPGHDGLLVSIRR